MDAKARNQQDSSSQILALENKGFEKVKLFKMKSEIFFSKSSFNPILASLFCEVTLESLSS